MDFLLVSFILIFTEKIVTILNKLYKIQKCCCSPKIKQSTEERLDDIIKEYLEKESEKKYFSDNNSKNSDICIKNHLFKQISEHNNNNPCCKNSNNSLSYKDKSTLLLLSKKNKPQFRIKLTNLKGDLFKENFDIIMNEQGIENFTPMRKAYDGITKFGIGDSNDFEIQLPESLKSYLLTLFIIEFNNFSNKFVLKPCNSDLNEEEGNIFAKVDNNLKISQKLFFSLGEVDFSVEPRQDLYINIEMNIDKKREFFCFDPLKKIIKIGRYKDCDIILKSVAFSRIQCTIFFNDENKFWYIQDGDRETGKVSMNGTWLFIDFPFEISCNLQLRIGKNLLELKYI